MARQATRREVSAFRRAQTGAALALALASVAPACLVTNDVDYSRPNTPAVVKKDSPADFAPFRTDCNEKKGMNFTATVYDPDVEDKLTARVLVNGVSIATERVLGTEAQRMPFQYCIPEAKLTVRCAHIEIVVSNAFSELQPGDDPAATEDPNDVGHAEWWLVGPAREGYADVSPRECNALTMDEP